MAQGGPRVCGVHAGRPLELFCEDCGRCVCALCPALGAHRGHRACLLPQAVRRTQELMALCLKDLEERKEQEAGNRRSIEQAVNDVKAHAHMIKRQLSEKVTELQLILREEESMAKNFIDEKTQLALGTHDQQLESCREQLSALETFSCQIKQIQQDSDPIQLLEVGPSQAKLISILEGFVLNHDYWVLHLWAGYWLHWHDKNLGFCPQKYTEIEKEMKESKQLLEQWHPVPLSFEHILNHYKQFIRVLQSILQKPLEARLKEDVFSSLNATAKKEPGTVLKTMTPIDRLLFLKHARTPTWEYDSVHPRLKLSDDRLVVSCSWRRIFYPCNPQRFDKLWQVLSKDAFLSGSHYWEVDLLHAGAGWWIGAAYPSIGRKGDSESCRLGWNRASWCLKKFEFEYWAFHKGERIPILIEDDPDRIGIFLDYEAGILTFYNVSDGMAHLHTFRCKFTEPVYPALRLWEGSIGTCKLP
ncbi:Tripartite motif-containing protein 14 [Willisornis vidua]|uniref:Tripartite motif-containing protein 14 n=1 Tax=Willisornis vidua TaxID=1566151 RepID=A0ABQ9DFD0_9PASS|nr:Tripartite motif-containing protein 14 [Willisornis vidua]